MPERMLHLKVKMEPCHSCHEALPDSSALCMMWGTQVSSPVQETKLGHQNEPMEEPEHMKTATKCYTRGANIKFNMDTRELNIYSHWRTLGRSLGGNTILEDGTNPRPVGME